MLLRARPTVFERINIYAAGSTVLLLLLCAVAHRLQLGTASYEGSMLAVVELLLFFLMLVFFFFQFLFGLYFLVRRRFRQMLVMLLLFFCCFVIWIIAAFIVDPHTLVIVV